MIRPKARRAYEQSFIKFCDSLGLEVTKAVGTLYYVANPSDPDSYWIVCPRPADPQPYALRQRTQEHYEALERALKAGKLHLMRYDPKEGLMPYKRELEAEIKAKLEPYVKE